ncbi:hypothetical protein PWG71_18215 [Nocardiopsis sp. N85]|uniref:hypothetical protein n=1 Tax=Nocardiopsis sp. N85 TaxID=3029400 RepID=UPI00237F7132|nr:hypothetical protein [Nocardiopsis sp. N85]MDE3723332.1 hypothetical protein [Nocardiopsis sp. N85]
MATHGFAAYRLWAAPPGRPDDHPPVDRLDDEGTDLLDLLHTAVRDLESTPVTDAERRSHLSVGSHRRTDDREIEVRLDYGRFGTPGTIRSVAEDRDPYHYGAQEAATTHLRALLVVPRGCAHALAMTERHQGRGAGTILLDHLKHAVDARLGGRLSLRCAPLSDSDAYRRFLESAHAVRVEVVEITRGADLFNLEDPRPMGTFRHVLTPPPGQRHLPASLTEQILARRVDLAGLFHLRGTDNITEVRLTLRDGARQKTVVLDDGGTAPPLTHLLAEDGAPRPSDEAAYRRMREVAAEAPFPWAAPASPPPGDQAALPD